VCADPYLVIRTESGKEIQTKLLGAYNFENIAVALCIGKFFGVDEQQANEAVATYEPANMRSQVIVKGTNTVILDAYNANPSSMEAAIRSLAEMNAEKKVLILGDMFELEEEAEKEHRAIGKLIADLGFTEVLLCGVLMKAAWAEFPKAKHFDKKEDLLEYLKRNPVNEATVLIKASRGIGLEKVMDVI
jgi:UDP-N-acetylmuramoyl-tripeptide--D-alanyl-D-alanine ligase